ncbi:recombination-associated protein RdgC [Thermodesulfobacteriota bacterium]
MGILSQAVSITRYRVDGDIEKPILETVANGLTKHAMTEIDDEATEVIIGWTSFENPFKPEFEGRSFSIGEYLVFSLRIDKKNIPSKIIKKYCALEALKALAKSGRDYLSAKEKKMIKEHVINVLMLRIPSTPNIYDIIWHYEKSELWFFLQSEKR